MVKSHYDTLGISKEADLEEIKKAFRVLSMQTHPDVASDKSQGERFKQISEAYRVLSNEKERKLYDLEVEQANRFGGFRRRQGSGFGSDHPHAKSPAPQGLMEIFFRPRNVLIGVAFGIFGGLFVRSLIRDDKKERQMNFQGSSKVEAWKNPKSGRWELPAPWDPEYRRLNPTLHFVSREKVQQRK